MATQPPIPQSIPPEEERRRSQRVLLVIPVDVAWKARDGKELTERAETEVVNAHGALLRMRARLSVGTEIELTHLKTGQKARARVVSLARVTPDGMERIGVELSVPSYVFWGVRIPPIAAGPAERD